MKKAIALGFSLFLTFVSIPAASATTLTYQLTTEFSGGTPPAGPSPWARITFDDGGGSGSVTITFDAFGLTANEFISNWYFNIDPSINPTAPGLVINDFSAVSSATISRGANLFQADGDGLFDFRVEFPTSGAGGGAGRFTDNEMVVMTLTLPGLTAASFNFGSQPNGGSGPFFSAAHVQGIGPNGALSGWVGSTEALLNAPDPRLIAAPEPGTLALLGLGLAAAARKLRRKS